MVVKPTFGNGLSFSTLNSLDSYALFTMLEPWKIIKPRSSKKPDLLCFNEIMDQNHLDTIFNNLKNDILSKAAIVGLGGGTSCDTAKYFFWRLKEDFDYRGDLLLIPSIISVDAFLCSSIAVRIENKVIYIGDTKPTAIIIDYDLIRAAPKFLNRAGVSDTISITSALGDWKIDRDENNGEFNQNVFDRAKKIAKDLMEAASEIKEISEKGIKALVNGFYEEVLLCEEWGNARPEEGSEHFLAYCLESITGQHYIHGNLIGMNILISLCLQEDYAEFSLEEVKQFFTDIQLNFSPNSQKIPIKDIKIALRSVINYVSNENLFYSIYNSPRLTLNKKKIDEIISFLKSQ
jgi:glycerol-1-phosphate dehydrogenase [NAD(P)+]